MARFAEYLLHALGWIEASCKCPYERRKVVVYVFAHVSEWSVPPERQDEATRAAKEHIVPSLRMQSGYLGDWLFGDRENGRMLTVTLWESEEAMHATDEHAHWYRTFGAQDTGGRVESARFFEVSRSEKVSVPPTA